MLKACNISGVIKCSTYDHLLVFISVCFKQYLILRENYNSCHELTSQCVAETFLSYLSKQQFCEGGASITPINRWINFLKVTSLTKTTYRSEPSPTLQYEHTAPSFDHEAPASYSPWWDSFLFQRASFPLSL